MEALFVGLEGVDGCGKSSVGELVAHALRGAYFPFPNDDTITGPFIRQYLSTDWWVSRGSGPCDYEGALAFQALQSMNRLEMMPQIESVLGSNRHVVVGRYWQSGLVYGSLDGLPQDFLVESHKSLPHLDVNILLDVPAETAVERMTSREGDPDRYEAKRTFTRQVVSRYREVWGLPEKNDLQEKVREEYGGRWEVVDASKPLPEVVSDVIRVVMQELEAQ